MTEPEVPGEHLSEEELEAMRSILDDAEFLARNVTPVPKLTRKELKAKLLKKKENND